MNKQKVFLVWYVNSEGRINIARITDTDKKAQATKNNLSSNKSEIEQSWIEERWID